MTPIIQALSFKTGRDLVLINVLSILLILVIIFFPNAPVRIILGLPFVLFFTGYVLISALFPRKEEIDIIERLAFSTGLSIAITPLIGLMLNYTPFGIRVYSILFSLFSFILLLSIVALYRRRTISRGDVFASLALERNVRGVDVIQEESNKEVRSEVKSARFIDNIFHKVKLEYIVLPLFIAISLFIYHQRYFSYIFMVIAAAIGVFLFIVFNRYFTKEEMDASFELPDDESHTLRLITSILFFIFYGLSFLALLQGFYTKTVWYYVFISLCAGVIATEILFVKTKTQGTLNLIKSFLLVLNITLSNQILFPYGIGQPDSGFHIYSMVIPIFNNGHVPLGYCYSNFPCHHIFVAISSLIAGSDPRMTYYCIGGFVMSVSLIFVFLIGRKFVNLKFGLFAALLCTCCGYLIMQASHPAQSTFTLPLAVILLTIILYIHKERGWRFVAFYPILVTTMVFMHHYSAMIVLIALSSLIIVEIFQRIKIPDYKFRFPGLVQIYVVILFAQWMYYSHLMGRFVGIIEAYYNAFTQDVATSVMSQTVYDQLPITILFINTLGASILIMLSVIGFLYFFKNRSFFKDTVMMLAIIIVVLIGIGVVLTLMWLLPHRLYLFLEAFVLVFLASAAIMWMLNNAKDIKSVKPALVIGVIICLSFFSSASTIAGLETSPLRGDQAYWKLYETPYERYSGKWADLHLPINTTVNVSHSFGCCCSCSNISFSRFPLISISAKNTTIDYRIDHKNITDGTPIFFSKFDVIVGFPYGWAIHGKGAGHMGSGNKIKLNEKEIYLFDDYNRYYDNGMIIMYYKNRGGLVYE